MVYYGPGYSAIMDRADIGGGPPRAATVGVASTIVLRENISRKAVIFTNDSDTIMYLARSQTAVLNAGIRLNANGGIFIDTPDIYGRLYKGPYAAISSAATKNLAISEDL